MSTIISAHEAALRKRYREKSLDRFAKWRWREIGMLAVAFGSVLTALICAVMAWKYATTIVEVDKVRQTDKFGQTIAVDARVYRVPADTQTHSLFDRFVGECFSVYNSAHALQRNYADCEGFFDARATLEKAKMEDYWSKHSPLKEDGSFDPRGFREADASIVSINSPGSTEHGGVEYELEWKLRYVDGTPDSYWNGDIIVAPGGPKTDIDPWGLYITHFSLSEMK